MILKRFSLSLLSLDKSKQFFIHISLSRANYHLNTKRDLFLLVNAYSHERQEKGLILLFFQKSKIIRNDGINFK